ncbi:MAG TPA: hypothetical protein VFG12_08970 [Rhodopila sp.]|jgi:hypothetical protein|nr:hypothetical protein [Rhodopila sp.]
MMVRRNTPIAQYAPDEPCHAQFLHAIANAHAALMARILCHPDMPAAEETRIMVDIGRIEYVAQCGRHLH